MFLLHENLPAKASGAVQYASESRYAIDQFVESAIRIYEVHRPNTFTCFPGWRILLFWHIVRKKRAATILSLFLKDNFYYKLPHMIKRFRSNAIKLQTFFRKFSEITAVSSSLDHFFCMLRLSGE